VTWVSGKFVDPQASVTVPKNFLLYTHKICKATW